jgi:hypothetical protein
MNSRSKILRAIARDPAPLGLVLVCVAGLSTGCAMPTVEEDRVVVDVAEERAFGLTWEEYRSRAILEENGGYTAEWDLSFANEAALREHWEQLVLEDKSKLVVIKNLEDGFEPTFTSSEKLNLTYCVSNSFTNKSTVVSDMASATKSWESVANLRFVYLSAQDASCNQNNANVQFAVMPSTDSPAGCAMNKKMWTSVIDGAGCQLTSAANAPRYEGILTLNYSASLPAGVTRRGVVRHELGHILGFRHEHPWDPDPQVFCEFQEYPDWDMGGRQLTAYNVSSVMHYPQCDGVAGADMTVSALDGAGARSIYGIPAAWYIPIWYVLE